MLINKLTLVVLRVYGKWRVFEKVMHTNNNIGQLICFVLMCSRRTLGLIKIRCVTKSWSQRKLVNQWNISDLKYYRSQNFITEYSTLATLFNNLFIAISWYTHLYCVMNDYLKVNGGVLFRLRTQMDVHISSCMLCTAQLGGPVLKASGRVQYTPFQLGDKSPMATDQHTAGGSVSQLSQQAKLSPWLTLSTKYITTSFWQ